MIFFLSLKLSLEITRVKDVGSLCLKFVNFFKSILIGAERKIMYKNAIKA